MPGLFASHDLPSSHHRGRPFLGQCGADHSPLIACGRSRARAREETELVPEVIRGHSNASFTRPLFLPGPHGHERAGCGTVVGACSGKAAMEMVEPE